MRRYGYAHHACLTLLYVAFLVLTSACNYRFAQSAGLDAAALDLVCASLLLNSLLLVYKALQLWRDPALYLGALNNFVDSLSFCLVYAGYAQRLAGGVESQASAQTVAAATVMLWVNLLYYLRPFRATSAVVRLLYVDRNDELKFFVFILAFMLFGFSQGLALLAALDEASPSHRGDTAFLSAFVDMMGQTQWAQFAGGAYQYLGSLLLVLLSTTSFVVMLNLLIAVLSFSHHALARDVEGGLRLELCRVMREQVRPAAPRVHAHVFVLRRLDDLGADDSPGVSFESLARVAALEARLEEVRRLLVYAVPREDEEGAVQDRPTFDLLRDDLRRVAAQQSRMEEETARLTVAVAEYRAGQERLLQLLQ